MLMRMFRGVLFASVFMLGACAAPALAGPPADQFGELAEPLNKAITVNFIGTPLGQAVDTIRRELNINVLIQDFVDDSRRITLSIKDMPAAQVLNLIGLASSTDWYIEQGVVVISTKEAVRQRSIETRVYNISDLTQSVPNYLGPDLSLNASLSNTNTGGSVGRQSESYGAGGGGGGGLFGDDSDLSEETLSRAELIEQIIELITDTCGTPDEWLDEESTLREINGTLIVKTTPDVHAEIAGILEQLSAARGRMVGIEGQFFAVPRGLMDGLEGKLVLTADELAAFAESVGDAPSRRISAGRTVCFDGQRVYVYAGHDSTFLSDIEPISGAAGVDPTLSNMRNGAVIDVMPTITLDGKSVSMAVRTDTVDQAGQRSTPVPVGSSTVEEQTISTTGQIDAEQAPRGDNPGGDIDGTVNQSGKIKGEAQVRTTGEVSLEMPEQDLLTHRTNVRVPNGGAVILSGVSGMYSNVDAQDMELVLILRARIVE